MAPKKPDLANMDPKDVSSKSRSANISSLSATLSKHQDETNKTMQAITKTIASVAKEQRDTTKKLRIREVGYSKGIKEVDKSMTVIMKKLGYTIDEFGRGAKKIAAQTAVATRDTLKQYSRAIGQDLSVNKQNMVAMALSQATPIFGYFAAKFMETDVFAKAKVKIQQSLADTFSVIGMKVREWWTKAKESGKGGIDKIKTKLRERKEAQDQSKKIKIEKPETIPKMQKGGYVQKGGVARLHAAEVVVPFDKLLDRFTKIFEPLSKNLKASGSAAKEIRKLRISLVGLGQEIPAGILEGFTKNPRFRGIFTAFTSLTQSFTTPLKFLFRPRGSYFAHIPRKGNPFTNAVTVLGLIYSATQPKLDAMLKILQNIGEALTGQKQKGVESKTWTMFERGKDFIQGKNKDKWKNQIIEDVIGSLGLDKKALDKSGATGFAKKAMGVKSSKDIVELKNISKKNLRELVDLTTKKVKTDKKLLQITEDSKSELTKIRKSSSEHMSTLMMIITGGLGLLKTIFGKALQLLSHIPGLGGLEGIGGSLLKHAKKGAAGAAAGEAAAGGAAGGTGGVAKPGLFNKGTAGKGQYGKYGGTGVRAGGIAGMGMGATMSTLAGAGAGIMSGMEVGKERGVASGVAQGMISGSLSTIGGLILGPVGTVVGKLLGDAIGKAAFGIGDWMAKNFNIFMLVEDYIINPITKAFKSLTTWMADLPTRMIDWITDKLPHWAKDLFSTKPISETAKTAKESIPEPVTRDPFSSATAGAQRGDSDWKEVPQKLEMLNKFGIFDSTEDIFKINENLKQQQSSEAEKSGGITSRFKKAIGFAKEKLVGVSPSQMLDSTPFPSQNKEEAKSHGLIAPGGAHIDRINPGMYKALIDMAEEYKQKTGKPITVTDGFRSMEEQTRLYQQKPDLAAPPGRSMHQFGVAADIGTATGNELGEMGLLDKYGFTRPMYPGRRGGKVEPWHIEPTAIQGKYNEVRSGGVFNTRKDLALKDQRGDATQVKEVFGKSFTDKSSIAKGQATQKINDTDALVQSIISLRDTTEKAIGENQKNNATIITNVTSSISAQMSSSMNSVANAMKDNKPSNKAITDVLSGNVG